MNIKVLLVSLFGLIILFFVIYCIFQARQNKNQNPQVNISQPVEEKTEIIRYQQTSIPQESKAGSCWTGSIAASSDNKAWRCSVGNSIYDPCFETKIGQVICGVNPVSKEAGFELKLIKPLPVERNTDMGEIKTWPWIVELQNGKVCYKNTGAADTFQEGDKEYYSFYFCTGNEETILLAYLNDTYLNKKNPDPTINKNRQPWQVKVAYLSDNGQNIISSELVDVLRIWQ